MGGMKHGPRGPTGWTVNEGRAVCSISSHDCGHIVASSAESGHNSEIATLVGEKPHGLLSSVRGAFAAEDDFLVGKRVGRVPHGGLDVLAREARVGPGDPPRQRLRSISGGSAQPGSVFHE